MIVSRTLAKHRIANGMHPNWVEAWAPVLVDGVLLFILLYGLFPWVSATLDGLALGWIFTAFFLLYFVPIQLVLILSALWAAKSRNTHDEADHPPE